MKKLLLFCLLIGAIQLQAQEFYGKATYKTHRKMNFQVDSTNSNVNEDMQKQLNAMLQKQFQKTFILEFTKDESTYKQEEQLEAPQPNQSGFMVQIVGVNSGSDIFYKNLKEQRYVNKTEIMGKRFLIKDSIAKTDWQLTGETKNIGSYTCYKATATREEERTSMTMVNGEAKEETKKETITTIAWYAPQIPVSNGPLNFGGLPGLILELSDDGMTMICSEIILNPEEQQVIKAPEKGKVVTQTEYDEIMQKKSQEMMEQYRSRRNSGDQVEIRIRG